MATRLFLEASVIAYSMIFSRGSKGESSSSPIERTAILISSRSDTPVERCCLRRK